MDSSAQDQLYNAVYNNDITNVKKSLQKDVNINTICSSGLTPLGAAAHLGNVTICETLIENYKRSFKEDSIANYKKKKMCINFGSGRPCRPGEHKNVGYYVVKKDLENENGAETTELGDEPTPEGMELLEWDVEIKDEQLAPSDPYSRLYKWYADILNRTSDIVKAPLHCDINQLDCNGRTALHYACNRGHLSIVQLLLSAGCNVNQTSSDDVTALHLACRMGHLDIVRLLLAAGAAVNHITSSRLTALHFAAALGHLGMMDALIESGADVNAPDFMDRTPLIEAVSSRNAAAVERLVRAGCRINTEHCNGLTPLCEAVWVSSLPIVHTLISAGAKLTQSHHLLHFAVLNNDYDVARLLVSAGSVVNLRDEEGNTPLIIAAKYGHLDTAAFLIHHGAMVNLTNSVNGAGPLYTAVDFINDEDVDVFKPMLELLLSHGANLEQQSLWDTPLFRAIFNAKTNIASTLIQYGADVNFYDPRILVDNMCMARKNKCATIVKMLIYAGYDLKNLEEMRSSDGTPLAPDPIFEWLTFIKTNPMSLMELCRLVIRKRLGKNVHAKINQLGLPVQLTKFLHLEYIQ